jgi:poly(A) polymerase
LTRDSTAIPSAEPAGALVPDAAGPSQEAPVAEGLVAEPAIQADAAEKVDSPFSSEENDEIPPEIETDKLDPDALKVVHRLRQHGYQAYFVGGCVRDVLVGRQPKDFDIGTSAHPGEVRALFRNCRLIGRRFRLAHVYFKGGKIIEVSTFRANPMEVLEASSAPAEAAEALAEVEELAVSEQGEGDALESEQELASELEEEPLEEGEEEDEGGEDAGEAEEDLLITHDNVFGTAEQDARRRDFTINGLFYDVERGEVIDYVRGRKDLADRLVRTIGNAERRMREDPVRILRAVRFACKLSFDIESSTYAAMEGAVEDLPRCAAPRLLEETFRLLRAGIAAPSLRLLSALDALKVLLPPIDAFLKSKGKEGEERFYAFAEAVDRAVNSRGEPFEDAVLLSALLLPIGLSAPATDEGGAGVAREVDELLTHLVRTSRLPKRIAERCRIILMAQKTLSGERRRRGSLASFRRHPLFNEALAVFSLRVEATSEHKEALAAWLAGSAPAPLPGPSGGAPPRRRRRRRRAS